MDSQYFSNYVTNKFTTNYVKMMYFADYMIFKVYM